MNAFEQKNTELIKEFNRYGREHPKFAEQIPNDAIVILQLEGDVVNLPLRRDGVIVQHFNDDASRRVRFVACELNLTDCLGVDRGCGFEIIEEAP